MQPCGLLNHLPYNVYETVEYVLCLGIRHSTYIPTHPSNTPRVGLYALVHLLKHPLGALPDALLAGIACKALRTEHMHTGDLARLEGET